MLLRPWERERWEAWMIQIWYSDALLIIDWGPYPPLLYLSQETSSSLFLVQLDISDRQHPTWYTQTSLTHINILCFAYLFVSLFSKRSFSISAFLFTGCWFLFIIFCYKEKSILGFRATFCTEIMGFCWNKIKNRVAFKFSFSSTFSAFLSFKIQCVFLLFLLI